MDVNGLRFWLLADATHWPSRTHTTWHAECGALRLASERPLDAPLDPAARGVASGAADRTPRAVDRHGAVARWDPASGAIVVRSYLPGDAVRLPLSETPRDLCVGTDGVLYVALPDRIRLHDLRGRWADEDVALAGFDPWRLGAAPDAVWALDRAGTLVRLTGVPLPSTTPQRDDYAPGVFRPDPENCRPPVLTRLEAVSWPAGESPLALAVHPERGPLVLSWLGSGDARVRSLTEAGTLSAPMVLLGARYAYSVAWLDAARIAVRMPGRSDAPAFAVEDGATELVPLGDVYPLARDAAEAPFAHRVEGPPRYEVGDGDAEPLLPLSLRSLARRGDAANYADAPGGLRAHVLDSGQATTVWHRLYVEAAIPPGTGFVVWLAATDDAAPPPVARLDAWYPHGFGRDIGALAPRSMVADVPRAAWERRPSELPGHPGLAPWTIERDRRGLFTALIQNGGARVRRVVGRFLWVRLELFGDGRASPEIAAVRAYASRFDYGEHYLPRLYRESLFGDAAEQPGERVARLDSTDASRLDEGGALADDLSSQLQGAGLRMELAQVRVEHAGFRWRVSDGVSRRAWILRSDADGIGVYAPRATPADFLSRFLSNFEGMLTAVEGRIAASHLLTDPASVPEGHLDWLAGWIGVAFEPALSAERRREWLRAAPALARSHGTRHGLALALDIATGGGVRGGEIVLIEHFRLRRLLATLLGVDLREENDPLLPGLRQSGNSIVGDTLILGDTERAELLALFRAEVATAAEQASVLAFLERLAHRATVLVHQGVTPQDLGLIARVAALESPAHVEVRVETATWPLLVGIASLVGVDTYLGPPSTRQPVRLDTSTVGLGDFVLGPVTLDPRITGMAAPAPEAVLPVADAGRDQVVPFGRSFDLDGSASRAAPGRSLQFFEWRQLPPTS
ncbi:MAG: phage tail protein [Vicinamibacterales bacterium]